MKLLKGSFISSLEAVETIRYQVYVIRLQEEVKHQWDLQ